MNRYQHERALKLAQNIENEDQIISRVVLGETINILNNKLKIDKKLLGEIYEALINDYIFIEDNYHYEEALNKVISYKKRLPFFDFITMSVMGDLKINRIVSFDEHFDLNKNKVESIDIFLKLCSSHPVELKQKEKYND